MMFGMPWLATAAVLGAPGAAQANVHHVPCGSGRAGIQRALDSGGRVQLGSCVYRINGPLEIPSSTSLRGAGRARTVLRLTRASRTENGGFSVVLQQRRGEHDVRVSRLTVDANEHAVRSTVARSRYRVWSAIVDIRYATDVRITRVAVRHPYSYGIMLWDDHRSRVTRSRTSVSTSGVYDQLDGIHIAGGSHILVSRNRIDQRGGGRDGDDGVAIRIPEQLSTCDHIRVTRNRIRGGSNGAGLQIAIANRPGCSHLRITRNVVHGSPLGLHQRWYSGSRAPIRDVTIARNLFSHNDSWGIYLRSGNYGRYTLSHNRFVDDPAGNVYRGRRTGG